MIIKGGIVLTPFETLRGVSLSIKNGKITNISEGDSFSATHNEKIIDASGKYIVPGFIDPHTHIGVCPLESEYGDHAVESSNPVTPELNVIDGLDTYDLAFDEALSGGVTTIGILPGSYMSYGTSVERISIVPGQGSIVKSNKEIIEKYAFLKIAIGEHPKKFLSENKLSPTTRMGIMSSLRTLFRKGKEYRDSSDKKKYDPELEAILPVLKKEKIVRVHVHTSQDILRVINLAKEFDLRIVLDHATEAYQVKEQLKDIPIVYGPPVFSRRGTELKNLDISNLSKMKGLTFSITTDHPTIPIQYINLLAGLSVSEGFSLNEALSLITFQAARALEIESRVGSLEVGKDADIVILSNEPFDPQTRVLYTIINGEIVYKGR